MFALDRFSDYKANLDDILHVGNASDAAPDSFAAQENFLSQLEIENKKIGKENEDDLLVALDQSLFKIYKGNVADWEPLSSTLYSNAFQENSQSSCLADIPPYVDNNISIVAASQSDNAALSENGDNQPNCSTKKTRTTTKTKGAVKQKRRPYKKRQKPNTKATKSKKTHRILASRSSGSLLLSCNNVTKSINIKPIQVSTVCSSTTISKHDRGSADGIVAPNADALLDLLEKSTKENGRCSMTEDSAVSSSTDKYKSAGLNSSFPVTPSENKHELPFNATSNENILIFKTSNSHLSDHSYCLPIVTSGNNSEDKNQAEDSENSVDAPAPKAPPSCKVLKWQDYLQRVRLGVRSAPNSPTTSPKIPRGAARKINNFMVMEGTDKSVKILMPIQSQVPKFQTPLLDPLTAVKIQTKTKTPIHLQEFEEYLAHLEINQKTSPTELTSNSPMSTDSPGSNISSSPISQPHSSSTCDVSTDDSTSPAEVHSSCTSKPIVTIHISPDSSSSVATPSVKNIERTHSKEESTPNSTIIEVTAADPRTNSKSKSTQPVSKLKPLSSVNWSSKPTKSRAPSFKLVSTDKDGGAAKSLVLNNVTGKLEEILSSLVKQQQQGPIMQNPEATAQQQETLQQLLAAISNLKAQEATPVVNSHAASTLAHLPSGLKSVASCSQEMKQTKKSSSVPSQMSLIHEIKQNISRKKSTDAPLSSPTTPPQASSFAPDNEMSKKVCFDVPKNLSPQKLEQSLFTPISNPVMVKTYHSGNLKTAPHFKNTHKVIAKTTNSSHLTPVGTKNSTVKTGEKANAETTKIAVGSIPQNYPKSAEKSSKAMYPHPSSLKGLSDSAENQGQYLKVNPILPNTSKSAEKAPNTTNPLPPLEVVDDQANQEQISKDLAVSPSKSKNTGETKQSASLPSFSLRAVDPQTLNQGHSKMKADTIPPNTPKSAEKTPKATSYPLPSSLKSDIEQPNEDWPICQDALLPTSNNLADNVVLQAVSNTISAPLALDDKATYAQQIPVLITSKPSPPISFFTNDCEFDFPLLDQLSTFTDMTSPGLYPKETTIPDVSVPLKSEAIPTAQETVYSGSILNHTDDQLERTTPTQGKTMTEQLPKITSIERQTNVEHVKISAPETVENVASKTEVQSVEKEAKDLEDGEISGSDAENSQDVKEQSGAKPNGPGESESKIAAPVQQISVDCLLDDGSHTEVTQHKQPNSDPHVHRPVHQAGFYGAQQNRGLKFSTEVRVPPEPEVYSDTLSLNDDDVGPRVYESDTSSYHKREKRRKSKKRKHKHKKHKKKHHRHSKKRRKSRHDYESSSDSSPERERTKRRKRRVSEESYSSDGYTSSDYERNLSPLPEKRRKYSIRDSPPRKRRSYASMSRSRSRSPRRAWINERRNFNEETYRRRNRMDSLSPTPSLERTENHRKSSYYEWDYISKRRMDNREIKDKAIKERRVMYVGRIANTTTKFFLRRRFRKFGPIDDVELYFRQLKDNYAFVTFHNTADAYKAIEHGNEGEEEVFDLCFGGRRQFCQTSYADLDEEGNNNKLGVQEQEDDFDTLLRKAMKR